MKRELERTQRERNKANLDRDQAKLERDQAKLERDQARRELDTLRAEQLQAERVRETAANCEQLKSELERIQQRQRELDMQKGARPKERVVTGSRPESRMEVDEAPRSKGRFNLDRAAQEHMNEGLEVWIPTESASSLGSRVARDGTDHIRTTPKSTLRQPEGFVQSLGCDGRFYGEFEEQPDQVAGHRAHGG